MRRQTAGPSTSELIQLNAGAPSAVGARWFCVHTQPHAEAKAEAHLHQQGFATYCPRYRRRRSHARKIETVSAPLFPRYLFVAFDINIHRWRDINSTIGVDYLVTSDDRPTPVAAGIVEQLQRSEVNGFVTQGLRATLASCSDLLADMSDREREALLLGMLDRGVLDTAA